MHRPLTRLRPSCAPVVAASLTLGLLSAPDSSGQLPETLEGYFPVPIAGEPLVIGGNGTVAPAGATLEFFYFPFAVNEPNLDVNYLVVGGGGGGGTSTNFGGAGSGGGGGGGVVTGSTTLDAGPVDVIIGLGGAPGPTGNNSGSNGMNSVFDNIVALGGGGGIGGNGDGLAGGSGGGGRGGDGGLALQPGSTSGGFGSPGGGGPSPGGFGGGGGGGADPVTGVGGGTDTVGGAGGDGLLSSISGVPARYGAGGGGGASGNSPIGFGGLGGGGSGANNDTAATAGLPDTGGGGGGGNNDRQGASGGSGIVIVSHTGGAAAASGGDVTTDGGTTIHTFTADNIAANNRVNITADVDGSGDITLIGDRLSPTVTTLVELSGNNSGFTGNLILDDIYLRVANGNALGGSGAGTIINPGSTLDVNGQNLQSQPITLAGGTITNTGAGQQNALRTVTVTADSTFTGSGRWDIRNQGGQRGVLDLNGHTVTKTGGNKTAIVETDISAGTINVTGGILGLTRSTMNSGTINVSNGARLEFENNTAGQFSYGMDMSLNNGRIDVRGASITTTGNLVLTGGDTSNTIDPSGGLVYQLAGNISGSGGFQKIGSGILVLSGDNTHSGNTRVNAGLLSATSTSAFGSGTVIANGGTIALLNDGAGDNGTIVYGNDFLTNSNNTATILVGNNGQNTGNTIVIANNDYNMGVATLNVEGMNDYNLRIESFRLGGGGSGTSVVNPTTANLILGNVTNSNANHTLELAGTSQGNIVEGNISQGAQIVSIDKTDSSTWTLAGNDNTHSGPTTVHDGTLNIAGVIQNSPVSVLSDGRLTGSGTINSSLAVDGGTLAPGDPNLFGLGTLTVNGPIDFASTWEISILGGDVSLLDHSGSFNGSLDDITLAAGSTFSPLTFVPYQIYQGDSQDPLQGLFENFSPGGFGSLGDATGTGELNGTLFAAYINSTLDGQGNLVSGNGIVLFAIPEPGRAMLAAIGLLAMLLRRRR